MQGAVERPTHRDVGDVHQGHFGGDVLIQERGRHLPDTFGQEAPEHVPCGGCTRWVMVESPAPDRLVLTGDGAGVGVARLHLEHLIKDRHRFTVVFDDRAWGACRAVTGLGVGALPDLPVVVIAPAGGMALRRIQRAGVVPFRVSEPNVREIPQGDAAHRDQAGQALHLGAGVLLTRTAGSAAGVAHAGGAHVVIRTDTITPEEVAASVAPAGHVATGAVQLSAGRLGS